MLLSPESVASFGGTACIKLPTSAPTPSKNKDIYIYRRGEQGREREKTQCATRYNSCSLFFLILCQLVCFPAATQIVHKEMDVFLDEGGSVTLCFPTGYI